MKLLTIALFMSAALAAVAQEIGDAGFPETGFVAELQEQESANTPRLRRFLAEGSGAGTPAPTPAPVTTAPPTPAPTPAPVTPAPATPTPATPAPETPAPTTAAPSPSPSPSPSSTPAPESSSKTQTPTPTTATPTATTSPPTDGATVAPNAGNILGTSSSSSASGTLKSTKTPAPTSSSSDTSTETESKMSTGTIAGIVGGIIAGVAVLACVTMVLIRRKRDTDDDPLSPFELSMDKGYGGAQAYGGAAPGYAAGNNAAQRNAPVHQEHELTDTPPAGAVAAGVAYSQFYDVPTSPGSANQQPRRNSSGHHDEAVANNNGTNLWMSAMEVKENDSYLSAKESHDDDSLNSGRNSYDIGYVDDQSSQISGNSDLNSAKDFPDYEDESARGSYEL